MTGVTAQLPTLTEHIVQLSNGCPESPEEANAGSSRPVVDLGEVDTFDVCGLQLLTVFLRHLKLLGFSPMLANTPEEFAESIRSLGFAEEFETVMEIAKGHA